LGGHVIQTTALVENRLIGLRAGMLVGYAGQTVGGRVCAVFGGVAVTEEAWLVCADPDSVLDFVTPTQTDRKLKLYACACCRRVLHWLGDPLTPRAIAAIEQHVDGELSDEEMAQAGRWAREMFPGSGRRGRKSHNATGAVLTATCFPASEAKFAAAQAADAFSGEDHRNPDIRASQAEKAVQCSLARDIFGNPFRPVAVDPRWQSENVLALATGIYADRAFDRMPILADALEEAGCDNADILNHSRGPGPHVRGCWVVDLVLGKG
jgi:hypothetical protein